MTKSRSACSNLKLWSCSVFFAGAGTIVRDATGSPGAAGPAGGATGAAGGAAGTAGEAWLVDV
ncbi:MAG: hypothetical protein KAU94_03495 [Verrucomicrobia bacterium]|nr:hypothetical protein [Verrucomicrobiota bacterium]